MKLIFVRHGQTDYNKAGIIQDQEKDIPLNDEGRAQVRATAEQVPTHVTRIISSPLKRALETAEILNERLHKEIEVRDNLKEFKYGSLAGKKKEEVAQLLGWTELDSHEERMCFDYRPFGGESAEDVEARVSGFIKELRVAHSNDAILITAHGGIIDAMHFLFPQAERPVAENASMHVFEL